MDERKIVEYGKAYKAIIEDLFGFEIAPEYGISEEKIISVESHLKVKIPLALREYYGILGRFDRLNTAHHRLLELDAIAISEGMLRFMDENQGVCTWAVKIEESDTDNPMVYQGHPIDNPDWYSEELKVSEFLTLSIYWQSVFGAFEIVGDFLSASEVLPAIESSWIKVVEHFKLRIWRLERMLIFNIEGDDICICAARDEQSFRYLEREYGFERQ